MVQQFWKLLYPHFQRRHLPWKFKNLRPKLPLTSFFNGKCFQTITCGDFEMLSEQWTSARILKQLMPKKKKRFEFFWAVAWEKTLVRHDLPLSLILCSSLSLCWWLLFSLFSGVFLFPIHVALRKIFAFLTYAFYCSLSRSSRRILLF